LAKIATEIGSTANRYQVLAKLAAGGMAEIFLARGASVAGVERYCVLKRILRERASDVQLVQMFVDEARLAAQLQHPNIASVYDIGILGDSYFFTMEYVHGETIRSLLQRAQGLRRPVPLACVLTIIAGAAAGLHHAHERNANDGRPLGIVHRDVSPSNLMVSYEGNTKVVDFGVAKAADRAVETKSGTVKGKISYLSPEQCRGARVDRRSDLFSLGIVMWEMLTGGRLYRRESDFENMTAIVNEVPPPPSARRPEVPREVDEIVLRLLAKSVADRFQTAAEVVEAIENASLRAGTILSTSAVSRLVRDLFGQRAEPWLEIEGDTLTHEPVTLASRPLPKEFGHPAIDAAERELASVLDLSSSSMFADMRDTPDPSAELPDALELPAGHTGAGSTTAQVDTAPLSPQAAVPTEAPVPTPTHTPAATPVLVSQTAVPAVMASSGAAPIEAPSTQSVPVATPAEPTMRPSPVAILAAGSSPPSVPIPVPLAPSNPIATALPNAAPLGRGTSPSALSSPPVLTLPSGSPAPIAPTVNGTLASASRVAWPLVAVIVIAAVIGVIAVWISMIPKDHGSSRSNAASGDAASLVVDTAPLDANDASTIDDGDIDSPNPAASAAPEPPPDARAATSNGPTAPPSDVALPAPTEAPPRRRPPSDAGVHLHPPSDSPRPVPVDAAPPARKPPLAETTQPSFESLSKLFHNDDYAAVVRVCAAAFVRPEIASVCLMAACQGRDTVQAKRWLPATDPARRDQLAAYCKGNGGVDLGTQLDCSKNPLDCR
jgi:eukaryotic-like serine/threonine-protein kinase